MMVPFLIRYHLNIPYFLPAGGKKMGQD